jgi:two-component system alkaline phosphatase synthesis response regulator PhoP
MDKKILVVDDDPNIMKLLTFRLSAEGYNVVTASDGQEALDKVRQEKPDLIILDITLPLLDGYQVCSTLRADEQYKYIPVVMLTASKEMKEIAVGLESGAVAYIQKPFKADVLLGIIKGFINGARPG